MSEFEMYSTPILLFQKLLAYCGTTVYVLVSKINYCKKTFVYHIYVEINVSNV